MGVRTRVDLGPEWNRAVAALIAADKKIPNDVNLSLRAVTARGVANARSKALTIPVHGVKHRGTRQRLARGVASRKTATGFRITTSMPAGEGALPRGFESQWGHPVYGEGWITQHSHYSWFTEPISNEYDNAVRAITGDLQDAARFIDKMSGGR